MNYKKSIFWIILIAVALVTITAVLFLTNPKSEDKTKINDTVISEINENGSSDSENIDESNQDISDDTINGTNYICEETGFGGDFTILLMDDGTFTYCEGMLSSYIGYGHWEKDGNILTLSDEGMGKIRTIVFEVDGNDLIYRADESYGFIYTNPSDGTRFLSEESITDEMREKLDKQAAEQENARKDAVAAVHEENERNNTIFYDTVDILCDENIKYSGYDYDFLFNFQGVFLERDDYTEPVHGEGTPKGWYALGGVGDCNDFYFAERETFTDGKLTDYTYLDNHSVNEKISEFTIGRFSGCLYKYSFDLVTAAEMDILGEGDSASSEYWVAFFTEGEGKHLFLVYLNADYYTQEDVLNAIRH